MDLVLIKIITALNRNINLYDAVIDGEPCYCIGHEHKGDGIIFEYEEEILQEIINKASEVGIAYDTQRVGCHFKFRDGVGLKSFLYARYHNLNPREIRWVYIVGELENGFCDCRRSKLCRKNNNDFCIEVLQNPHRTEEEYIVISIGDRTEVMDYSEDLYTLLTELCYVRNMSDKKRLKARIVDSSTPTPLSRLVFIFQTFYPQYANTPDGIRQFANEYKVLSCRINEQCGHINACSWNHSKNNMLLMSEKQNGDMRDYIKYFCDKYQAFAIGIRESGNSYILLMFEGVGGITHYFKLTIDEFVEMQRCYLNIKGEGMASEELNININGAAVDSPEQCYKKNQQSVRDAEPTSREECMERFWKWCDSRNRLIEQYQKEPESFERWMNPVGKKLNNCGVALTKTVETLLGGMIFVSQNDA